MPMIQSFLRQNTQDIVQLGTMLYQEHRMLEIRIDLCNYNNNNKLIDLI